jgi:hypothetical protein
MIGNVQKFNDSLGVTQYGLGSGQTAIIPVDMATSDRNIDSFSIFLPAIAGYPILGARA